MSALLPDIRTYAPGLWDRIMKRRKFDGVFSASPDGQNDQVEIVATQSSYVAFKSLSLAKYYALYALTKRRELQWHIKTGTTSTDWLSFKVAQSSFSTSFSYFIQVLEVEQHSEEQILEGSKEGLRCWGRYSKRTGVIAIQTVGLSMPVSTQVVTLRISDHNSITCLCCSVYDHRNDYLCRGSGPREKACYVVWVYD